MVKIVHERIEQRDLWNLVLGTVQSSVSPDYLAGIRRNTEVADLIRGLLDEPDKIVSEEIGDGRVVYVAVGNTIMSPNGSSLGGCRWKRYRSPEEAERDVRKLARGMTYKWGILSELITGLAHKHAATPEEVSAARMGGGKCVIYEPEDSTLKFTGQEQPLSQLEQEVLRQAVRVMQSVNGYITAPDSGTDMRHMSLIRELMPDNVVCLPVDKGGSGDPSIVTAKGVYQGMLAWVRAYLRKDGLNGLTLAIQGTGKVGGYLIRDIVENNPAVRLIIAEPNEDTRKSIEGILKSKRIESRFVDPSTIYDQEFDLFSPNALGQVLKPDTVARMVEANKGKELLIVGAANNQIDDTVEGRRGEVERLFREHNVHYAPDFVVNLGGILNVMYEFSLIKGREPYSPQRPLEVVEHVRGLLRRIHDREMIVGKDGERLPTTTIAERMATEQMARWAIFKGLTADDLIARRYESKIERYGTVR